MELLGFTVVLTHHKSSIFCEWYILVQLFFGATRSFWLSELDDIYFKNKIFFCLFLTILLLCNAVFNIRIIKFSVDHTVEDMCQQKSIL